MDETRAVARLPGLDIAIEHRVEADAELLTVSLRATPGFDAVAQWLDPQRALALWMGLNPWLAPWLAANPFLALPVPPKRS
jgi:hypothetical protein